MKTIINRLAILALTCLVAFSCEEQFDVSNPGTVDSDFVFSSYETGKTVLLGAYNTYIKCSNNSEGFFCNGDNIGSDVERCSVGIIAELVGAAQMYGGKSSYAIEVFNTNASHIKGVWANMYKVISLCNQVIYNIKAMPEYETIISTAPNDWSDLLGQAHCLRATLYYDLARYFGDALYIDEPGKNIVELSSRDYIIEKELEHVIFAEKLMYAIGENNHFPDQMTRNYADGLIARMCFMEAGYATRRTDLGADFYTDKDGKTLTFEVWGKDDARNAEYGRRTDWKKFYEKALPYLKKAVEQPAGVKLTVSDPRSDSKGRTFGNPFQYYFEQITQQVMAEETIYEVSMKEQGGGSRIAYNYGRGSNGGSPAYPPKANAQTCSYPQVWYELFDPADMRRDASLSVTGSTGNGAEMLYSYGLSNKCTIGIGMNKYDLNRQINPDARQLYSGINLVKMRQSDVILMYAEALAVTGNTSDATNQLKVVHNRAFPDDVEDAKFAELLARNNNDVLEAIYEERSREFVGEGLRRWDLIRTGKLPEVAVSYRNKLIAQTAELKANGYVKYDNGNEFPAYVWTKLVDGNALVGYRLTASTPEGLDPNSDEYAMLFPGYRGQHDSWETVAAEDNALAKVSAGDMTNLAILGLTKHIVPGSAEAQALEARGYKQTPWGVETYQINGVDDGAREANWSSEFFCGYTDADLAAKKAPIYLHPMQSTTCVTTGLKNGYGFKSE